MIGIRIDGEEIWLEPEEWELWLEDGRVPPRAWVQLGGGWMRVTELPQYVTRPSSPQPTRARGPGLREILFPRRGLSATEGLILLNVLVAVALLLVWRGEYLTQLRIHTGDWWYRVRDDRPGKSEHDRSRLGLR